jgi:hypothetical protein
MLRSVVIALLLISLLLASAPVAVAADPVESATSNIGLVLYTKSLAPGTLNARWIYGKEYRGPGIATGGPKDGLVGKYHVRYFLENGEFSDEYDLVIEQSADVYNVSWITDGKLSAVGVGMEVDDGLAVGWRRVAD